MLVQSHNDVLAAMEHDAAAISRRMTAAVLAEVRDHAAVRDARFAAEVREHSKRHVHAFVKAARDGRPPAGAELDFVRERGAQRARELLPLDVVLQSYLLGQRLMWEALVEAAAGDDRAALDLTATTFAYAAAVNAAVAEGWTRAASEVALDEERVRRDVVDRLLLGDTSVARRAAALGLDVGEELVVVVATAAKGSGRGAALRPITDALARSVGPHRRLAFVVPRHDEVVAFVPVVAAAPGGVGAVVERAQAALGRFAGVSLRAGVSARCGSAEEIPAAYEEARRALRHASAARPVVRLEEVSLADELTAGADAAARRTVPAAARTIAKHPALVETVVALADNDLNVARTAAALHLHANTVQYRLRRIEELTGADARRFATLSELVLGLRVLRRSSER
ncbi:MAG TPA: helix-turn-helix domain-containing protein [Solirubrobacteraceae bacterium]|jgi:hypothetical protein